MTRNDNHAFKPGALDPMLGDDINSGWCGSVQERIPDPTLDPSKLTLLPEIHSLNKT
ncbi:uncharacterized protein TrAFT101_002431 [Trichoderma asperellum]|uniref:uncharacterized protein n=1 Tax=Trichoderma asperellum TaxID=101201 RepID=UPI003323F9BA|nr:hypothetical protein TrAFT101_002431 [Trichoderma asperellum]